MRSFDYSKLKEHQWDSEVLGLVAQIHEFKGRQELYLKQKPAALEKLIEIAKIQMAHCAKEIVFTEQMIHLYRNALIYRLDVGRAAIDDFIRYVPEI